MILDVVGKYKETKKLVITAKSAKKQLITIIDFFVFCDNSGIYPPHTSFIKEFTPSLLSVFKSANVSFVDPFYLSYAKKILDSAKQCYDNEIIIQEINTVQEFINVQLIKLYFFLGEYKNGLFILKQILCEYDSRFKSGENYYEDKPDISNKRDKNYTGSSNVYIKQSLVSNDFFKENRALEILRELKQELELYNSYSFSTVNIMLVEEEYTRTKSLGLIQELSCQIKDNRNNKTFKAEIENIVHKNEADLNPILENLTECIKKLIKDRQLKYDTSGTDILLKFKNLQGIYKGTSFAAGAVLLALCSLLKHKHSINNYSVSYSAAFTGSVDQYGNLQKLPEESVEAKVSAAFFSWIKYCILPSENYKSADNHLKSLKKKYPKKQFELIPAQNISEILDNSAVVKSEKDPYLIHLKKIAKQNILLTVIVSSVIFLTLGLFIALKLIPKDIKPLPTVDSNMYLIYAPDRDTNWLFQNKSVHYADTLNFGDVAIGDMWSYSIQFFNNSRESENFIFSLNGKDSSEFDYTFSNSAYQPNAPDLFYPERPLNLIVKFCPYKEKGLKECILDIKSKGGSQEKKIYLKGFTDRFNNGYSASFKNEDDQIIINTRQVLIKDDFTISFWFKLLQTDSNKSIEILRSEDDPPTNNKFTFGLDIDSILYLTFYPSKSKAALNYDRLTLSSEDKIKTNVWNFIAISRIKSKVYLVLNNHFTESKITDEQVKNIQDYIMLGNSRNHPHINEKNEFRSSKTGFLIDEFRIYRTGYEPEILINNKLNCDFSANKLSLGYSFDEMNSTRTFDLSYNDLSAENWGGITRSLDTPQEQRYTLVSGTKDNQVFHKTDKGFAKFSRNIFTPYSDFTIQYDAKVYLTNSYRNFVPSMIMIPGFDFNIEIMDSIANLSYRKRDELQTYDINKSTKFDADSLWHKYTMVYSNLGRYAVLFIDNVEVVRIDTLKELFDVTRNYYGIAFGNYEFLGAPFYYGPELFMDNIKIYDKALNSDEIKSNYSGNLIAFWDFESFDKELTFDKINNLPLLMFGNSEIIPYK